MSQRQYALPRAGDAPRLLYVSRAQYSGDWNSSLHTHGCAELFFITGGHGRFRTQREEFPVAIHDAVIVNANIPHTEVSQLDSPLEYTVLGVEGLETLAGAHGPAAPPHRLGGADGLPAHAASGGGGRPAGL